MSRVRGFFPLFLATTIGIGNGLWVFGPAFKEQQREREEQDLKAQEATDLLKEDEIKTLKDAEENAGRKVATEFALKPDYQSSSWWQNMSIWSRGTIVVTAKPPKSAVVLEDNPPKEKK